MNNKELFVKDFLQAKSLDFTTAKGQILHSKSIGTITISSADGLSLRLNNVAYASNCNSNLILLRYLRENNIKYVNNIKAMTPM